MITHYQIKHVMFEIDISIKIISLGDKCIFHIGKYLHLVQELMNILHQNPMHTYLLRHNKPFISIPLYFWQCLSTEISNWLISLTLKFFHLKGNLRSIFKYKRRICFKNLNGGKVSWLRPKYLYQMFGVHGEK